MVYKYYREGTSFFFSTISGAIYVVKINPDQGLLGNEFSTEKLGDEFFEFSFSIVEGQVDASDKSISATIVSIAEEWMNKNNKVLFFICSSVDRSSKARMRLFQEWARSRQDYIEFSRYELKEPDGSFTEVGTIVRIDYSGLDNFRGRNAAVIQKLNDRK